MSLLALLLGAAVLQDSPSFCTALQQLVELVSQAQLLQQFLPLEEHVKALLQLFLHLLLLDFYGNGFQRHAGRSRLQGDGGTFDSVWVFFACASTIYLQLMSVNNLDNSVCSSYLDNKRDLNLK